MVSCSVLECKVTGRNNPDKYTFHRFPTNQKLREEWVRIINRPKWTANKYSQICSKHFEGKCFIQRKHRRVLMKDSIPTLSVPNCPRRIKEKQNTLNSTAKVSRKSRPTTSGYLRKKQKPARTLSSDLDLENDYNGFQCNNCRKSITGFRYTCVQCTDYDLCSTCEARGVHDLCYVLRVPQTRLEREVREMLQKIRGIIALDLTDKVKVEIEIKEEDPLLDSDKNDDATEEFGQNDHWDQEDNYATEKATEETVLDESITDFSIVKTEEEELIGNQVHVVQDRLSNLLAKKSSDELLDTLYVEPTVTQPSKKVRTSQVTSSTAEFFVNPLILPTTVVNAPTKAVNASNKVTYASTTVINTPTKKIYAPTKVSSVPSQVTTPQSTTGHWKSNDKDRIENQVHAMQDGLSDLLAKPFCEPTTLTKPVKKVVIPAGSSKVFKSSTDLVNLPARVINTSTQVINAPTNVVITSNKVISAPSQVKGLPAAVLRVQTDLIKKSTNQSTTSSKQFPSSSKLVNSGQSAASGNINTPGTLASSVQKPGSSREVTDSTSYTPKMFIQIDSGTISLPGSSSCIAVTDPYQDID